MPPTQEPAITGEWECMECGYIEKGVEARRPPQCRECSASARARSSSRMMVGQKATTTWMMWMTERTSASRPLLRPAGASATAAG